MLQLLLTISETLNTLLFPVVNFLKCAVLQKLSYFQFAFKTIDISHSSVATHSRGVVAFLVSALLQILF